MSIKWPIRLLEGFAKFNRFTLLTPAQYLETDQIFFASLLATRCDVRGNVIAVHKYLAGLRYPPLIT